jgi:hypothetical protein
MERLAIKGRYEQLDTEFVTAVVKQKPLISVSVDSEAKEDGLGNSNHTVTLIKDGNEHRGVLTTGNDVVSLAMPGGITTFYVCENSGFKNPIIVFATYLKGEEGDSAGKYKGGGRVAADGHIGPAKNDGRIIHVPVADMDCPAGPDPEGKPPLDVITELLSFSLIDKDNNEKLRERVYLNIDMIAGQYAGLHPSDVHSVHGDRLLLTIPEAAEEIGIVYERRVPQ